MLAVAPKAGLMKTGVIVLKLIIEDDEGRKTVVPFVRDEITIGRQEGNTIRLTERNVSRKHARLLKQNGHIFVEDLGSYNGIKINGDRVRGQVSLNEGDLVQIGDYDLAVQRELEATTPPPGRPHNDLESTSPHHTPKLPDTAATAPSLPAIPDAKPNFTPTSATLTDLQSADSEDTLTMSNTATQPLQTIPTSDSVTELTDRSAALDLDPEHAPRLVVMNTEFAGREFACIRRELTLGRTDDNDIAIDHRSLSRNHCKIVRDDQADWRVIDLASANGLLVNGEVYQQSVLKSGDVLELGQVKLKFVLGDEAVSLTHETEEVDAGVRGGGRVPMYLGLFALVVGIGGVGYWVFDQAQERHGKTVTPEVGRPPRAAPDDSATKLTSARDAIERLDWVGARATLKACQVGSPPCTEAQPLLDQMDSEEIFKSGLDSAEQQLNAGKLVEAKAALDGAAKTQLLTKRHAALSARLASMKPPSSTAKPDTAAAEPSSEARAAEVAKFLAAGRAALKEGEYAKARTWLESCVKLDPLAADCHMTLGATYARLEKSELGLKHYKRFLELAPNHEKAPKVQQIVDAYAKTQGSK